MTRLLWGVVVASIWACMFGGESILENPIGLNCVRHQGVTCWESEQRRPYGLEKQREENGAFHSNLCEPLRIS